MLQVLKKYELAFLIAIYSAASAYILISFNGTGVEADSINHYLYAKYAPSQPELYFNHWAKPVFTLLASPFAQFGFLGIKIFNVLCGLFASVFLYLICKKLNLKNAALAPLFYFIFPLSFTTTFSGLTEPLFAFIVCSSIYLLLKNNYLASGILLSFIPFIRSEGLILLGIFGVFFIVKKQWKALLLLSVGHLVFSLAGFFYFKNFLWVFTKIPYASLNSPYGDGSLFHFADKLNYIMGLPLLLFFCIGVFLLLIQLKKQIKQKNYMSVLIFLLFLSFFIAHSLFWYLGIFNSMGLKRVFAAITPIMAIICLIGFNSIELMPSKKVLLPLKFTALLVILIFPFTSNPAAMEWENLNLSISQQNAVEVSNYIKESKIEVNRFVYSDPYLGEVLNINPFDFNQQLNLAPVGLKYLEKGDLIIWDNWHSVVDYGVKPTDLKHLKLLKTFKKDESQYTLYLYQ